MRGQSTLEYTMFVVAAAAALIGMSVYIRRSIQANLKTVETQINQEAVRESSVPAGPPQPFSDDPSGGIPPDYGP